MSQKDDGVIDFNEFCTWMEVQPDDASQCLFRGFDLNDDQVLNFREFVLGISNLTHPKIDFIIKYSFSLFDKEK